MIKLDQDFGTSVSGVLADGQARVLAFWGSYAEQVGDVTLTFYFNISRPTQDSQEEHLSGSFVYLPTKCPHIALGVWLCGALAFSSCMCMSSCKFFLHFVPRTE